MSELYLIRHAQASFGTDNYDQLSELGKKQSQALGVYFDERRIKFHKIFSGTLTRHKETLEIILERTNQATEMKLLPELNEFNSSELFQAYAKKFPRDGDVMDIRENPFSDPRMYYRVVKKAMLKWSINQLGNSLTESWQEFQYRTATGLDQMCPENEKNCNKLVVTSGGVIAMLLQRILNISNKKTIDLMMQIRNCSITHCYYSKGSIQLAGFNNLPHLDTKTNRSLITLV